MGQQPQWHLCKNNNKDIRGQSVRGRPAGESRADGAEEEDGGQNQVLRFLEIDLSGLLSGAPSLARQPERSHRALTSHLVLALGRRPGRREGYGGQSFPLGGNGDLRTRHWRMAVVQ